VEIPARRWKEKDVVEVVMPFTKHLDFGPDKADGHWLGTLMYGPLVMATTGISSWDEATATIAPDLSDVQLMGATPGSGADANIYTLNFHGHTFIPDYQADRHITHYLRLNMPADPAAVSAAAQASEGIDRSALRELLQVARQRADEQQTWNNMSVKVPEYAPWAPHAFQRMTALMAKCQQLLDAPESGLRQQDIEDATANLNAIINQMRPGNLPELEDMEPLMKLIEQAKQQGQPSQQLQRALDYAGMVVRYVSDGSGTHDMIERAMNQLNENINEKK
jgi:hypothetical protein